MTARLDRPATRDRLFLWVMHRFAEVFEKHAVIKGGMALRLLDSPRHTMDIDYVFVPFSSKKEIVDRIGEILHEIDGAEVDIEVHAKMLRAGLRVDAAAIQIEVNVAERCETIPMATGGFARSVGQPSQVVRIMSPSHALSHKIAAWNERRLFRDLFDCYFLAGRAGALPDLKVLDLRLSNIQSRLPKLRRKHSMTRTQLVEELGHTVNTLSDTDLEEELAGLLPPAELAGLAVRIRAAMAKVVSFLSHN